MDTISRENNSMLPIGGIIVGALALILGLYLLTAVSKVKNQVADQEGKMNDISTQVSAASSKVDQVKASLDSVAKQTQDAFTAVGNDLGTMKGDIATLKEAATKHVAASAKGGSKEPVVAGPGEYVIKSGDTLAKVARANGVSLADLQAVNPGVDSRHLHVGQKIKLPEKKA
ncbi:MAG: LysM domain-containing protein [Opitutaceae bacterium]|jgi:LysM repeat protein